MLESRQKLNTSEGIHGQEPALQVFSSVRGDIGTRKQDRVVRLDLGQQGTVSHASILELERQLAEAFRVTFAARQAAYDDQVVK